MYTYRFMLPGEKDPYAGLNGLLGRFAGHTSGHRQLTSQNPRK